MNPGCPTAACVRRVGRRPRAAVDTPMHRMAVHHLTTALFLSKLVRPLLPSLRPPLSFAWMRCNIEERAPGVEGNNKYGVQSQQDDDGLVERTAELPHDRDLLCGHGGHSYRRSLCNLVPVRSSTHCSLHTDPIVLGCRVATGPCPVSI